MEKPRTIIIDLEAEDDVGRSSVGPPETASPKGSAGGSKISLPVKEEEPPFNIGPMYFGGGHCVYDTEDDDVENPPAVEHTKNASALGNVVADCPQAVRKNAGEGSSRVQEDAEKADAAVFQTTVTIVQKGGEPSVEDATEELDDF
jgi:hypothetical protein